jgi:UDP-N-acetylglucosamine 4,6-dehydratase
MCPADDSHLTLEFTDHYVLRPTISFTSRRNSFDRNGLGEQGRPVPQGFEYNSGTNPHFFTVQEIKDFNQFAEA